MTDTFVGVDVAKGEFVVVCRPDGVRWTATNDSEGIAATVARLRSLDPRLIVLKATGGKPKKLALTGCMRKLLTILNAMMRTNTTWQQSSPPARA